MADSVREPGSVESPEIVPKMAVPVGGVGDSPVRGTLVQRGGAEEARQAHNLEAAGSNPAPVTSKALSRDLAVVQKVDNKLRRRAEAIVSDTLLGPSFDPTGEKPVGMSARRWRVIKASWANLKAQPGWLATALRVHESYAKQDAGRPPAPTINADLIQINVLQVNQLPVRKVRED